MRAEAENVDGRVGSVPGPPEPKPAPRKLLVLDSAFCLEAIRARGLEASVTCRDLGGYFEHVWSVHPMASLVSSRAWGPEFGAPDQYELSAKHTLIEGKVGRGGFRLDLVGLRSPGLGSRRPRLRRRGPQ